MPSAWASRKFSFCLRLEFDGSFVDGGAEGLVS
jgi:hypothetical protein